MSRRRVRGETNMNRETTCIVCCGAGGSVACIAVVAWLALPPIVSALGGQLALPNPVLIPLIVLALVFVSGGLGLAVKSHGRVEPLLVSLLGAVTVLTGIFMSPPVAALGVLMVAGAIGWNYLATVERRQLERLP